MVSVNQSATAPGWSSGARGACCLSDRFGAFSSEGRLQPVAARSGTFPYQFVLLLLAGRWCV
jgi:hypothetical protein